MAAAATVPMSSSQLLICGGGSRSAAARLSPFVVHVAGRRQQWLSCPGGKDGWCSTSPAARGVVRCAAVGTEAAAETKKKSSYEIQTLTGWLLKQEQAGTIDAELTIVLSSISMACKQIASLVQRAGISNLTGVQGAVNIQGEDQKKLDVVSNEVNPSSAPSPLLSSPLRETQPPNLLR